MKCAYLVKVSTKVTIALLPLTSGKLVIKFIEIYPHGCEGVGKGKFIPYLGVVFIFMCSHVTHFLQYLLMTLDILGK